MERQQWSEATPLAEQALTMVSAGHLNDYIMSPLVHTVAARTALHRGNVSRAKLHLVPAARLRPLLTYAVPWGAVQTLLEMARAYLMPDDAAGARTVLRQARDILQLRPDLCVLPDQAEELHAKLGTTREGPRGVDALHGRAASAPAAGDLPLLPGDRRATVRLPTHGEDPGDLDLPQARRLLAQRGGPAVTGDRPARGVGLARRRRFIPSG
jgi:hypothetical protein